MSDDEMNIRPYQSGRKGQHVPFGVTADEQFAYTSRQPKVDECFALDARILQEDAFCHEATRSMKYLLLLNGVIPNVAELDDPLTLHSRLASLAPDSCPGECGAIAILLIL
jgi:hypothetical protein